MLYNSENFAQSDSLYSVCIVLTAWSTNLSNSHCHWWHCHIENNAWVFQF